MNLTPERIKEMEDYLHKTDVFHDNLTDKSKKFILDRRINPINVPVGLNLINFSIKVQFPVKDWYQIKTAELFNELIENDLLDYFITSEYLILTNGDQSKHGVPGIDFGPDEYAAICFMAYSKHTFLDICKKLHLKPETFYPEGNISHLENWNFKK